MAGKKVTKRKTKVKAKANPKAKVKPKKKTAAKKTTAKKTGKKRAAKSKKVSAIPKGYTSITPYLIMESATKAIDFYKKIFGAKVVMQMEMPTGKVAHAELKLGEAKIMLADENPQMGAHSPRKFGGTPVSILFYTKNVDNTVKQALDAGAKLMKPVQDMFYGDRSGTVMDPFGHIWTVATHIEDVSQSQMRKRSEALFNQK